MTSIIDWIDAGGPNLYWGLASLPSPLVDIQDALRQEMNLPLQMFPFLKDPESLSYTPRQWRFVIGDSLRKLGQLSTDMAPDLLAQTAALQTIEAIRMATADAGGTLPSDLNELQQCPAPLDPITGAPFIYRVENGKAVLELPPPEGRPAELFGKRFEISLKTP